MAIGPGSDVPTGIISSTLTPVQVACKFTWSGRDVLARRADQPGNCSMPHFPQKYLGTVLVHPHNWCDLKSH